MKKLLFALSIVFGLLCFAGIWYVLANHGQVNAGYAVIPMLFALICSQGYQRLKKKD